MRICHFEDARVATLEPIALTRPAYELRCGMQTLAQKQRRFFQINNAGALVRPYLVPAAKTHQPQTPVNDFEWLGADTTLLVNARWLTPARPNRLNPTGLTADCPFVAVLEDEIAYAVLPPAEFKLLANSSLEQCLDRWRVTLPTRPAGGQMLRYLWEVVEANAEQIAVDFNATRSEETPGRPSTLTLVGPSDGLRIDPTARIDPFVVADTTNGPVIVDRSAVITSFTRLEGPCWIGPRAQVFGANIRGGTSIGPNCRIGGAIEASIIQANSNKYHEGFLGHSYIGEWVNLGAGTHISDLRNDYAEVKVVVNGVPIATGRNKTGSYIGDHTKTGLGSLINAGANVGVFANLLPAGILLPKFVPSFCWVEHGQLVDHGDLSSLFATAVKAMQRRGEEFTELHRDLYQHLYDRSASMRRQAIHEDQVKRLRKSA